MKITTTMNYRILTLLLIGAIIGAIGWHNSRRLAEVHQDNEKVMAEAKTLGIGLTETKEVSHKSKIRERNSEPIPSRMVSPDDIAYVKFRNSKPEDRTLTVQQGQALDFAMDKRLKAMTPLQIRKYIAEVRTYEELTDKERKEMVDWAVARLETKDPAEGVSIHIELLEKYPQEDRSRGLEEMMVAWAKKDPVALLACIRANMAKHGDKISNASKGATIDAIAKSDRKLAFQLIGELKLESPAYAPQGIVAAAKTAEERIAALADLRDYLPTIKDPDELSMAGDYAIAIFGRALAKEGFQTASEWVSTAGLTNSEIASFGSDMGTSLKHGDQGKWIEWFGEKLSDGKYRKPIRQVMQYWAQNDYHAAGTWLAATPAGPAKDHAIRVYAETVSNYEPEAAVQWAVTLPVGKDRQDTLHQIYHNWPTKDPAAKAAAAAFEKEYNIQHDH